jgi:membrane fusion protein, heavy metal efflux system
MNRRAQVALGWPTLIVGALAVAGAGAGIAYLTLRVPARTNAPSGAAPPTTGTAGTPSPASQPDAGAEATVTLTPEAVKRAGLVLARVTTGAAPSTLRLPGVVEPNAYKQVVVTPLLAGRVTRVLAELGQNVRAGQTLAELFSPELAEAETRFVSARAELDAHDRELQRTEKLVEIGSASRQELERLHAEHTAKLTAVESARLRLQLLGLSPETIANLGPGKGIAAVARISAPIAGVVTERTANAGLNVDTTTKLFVIVDLSTVWIVAEVYEKDFSRIHVGAAATVTTKAFPDRVLRGRVSYVDPQVNAETRTAKARIEVANPGQDLRLGMFADAEIAGGLGQSNVAMVPRAAVQNVGDRTVVYVADPDQPGRFVERTVRLGDRSANEIAVLSGVQPREQVVAEGSFNVRAERDRLGLAATATHSQAGNPPGEQPPATRTSESVSAVKVSITESGFEPAKVTVKAGAPARITFVRTTDKTCATEVVFPSQNIRRALPLNQPVTIEFTPKTSGEIAFTCGMNMLKGAVVVQ